MKLKRGHDYVEAYCLMLYRAKDGSEEETIWNSRDGITPFGVNLRSGKPAEHAEWRNDRYAPFYVPQVGERVFVSYTPETARQVAERIWEDWSKRPDLKESMAKYFPGGRAHFVAFKAFDILQSFWPCSPNLVEVDEEMHEQFRKKITE